MFKTITPFRLVDASTRDNLAPTILQAYIPEPTVIDPDTSQWSRAGFSKPDQFGESVVFVGANDTRLFNVQVRERVLPGKVIKTKLLERAADYARRQGYAVSRKILMELKDDVIATLLPTAFIKPVDVLCMITGNYLFIGASSARLVDTALGLLRSTFPDEDLRFRPICANREVSKWMLDLLLSDTTEGANFNVGEAVTLRGKHNSTARFKDMALAGVSVQDAVRDDGMRPTEIALTWNERIGFSLNEMLTFKRIRFSDVLLKQIEEDTGDGNSVVQFDATAALVAGELSALVNDLMAAIPEEEEL